MVKTYNSSYQANALSIYPLERQAPQHLLEETLKDIHGGLRPPIPSIHPLFPLIPDPPFVPGICPPAPELD